MIRYVIDEMARLLQVYESRQGPGYLYNDNKRIVVLYPTGDHAVIILKDVVTGLAASWELVVTGDVRDSRAEATKILRDTAQRAMKAPMLAGQNRADIANFVAKNIDAYLPQET